MRILAVALCVFLVFGAGSLAVAESDHDRARAAVRDGRSLPLHVILNQARSQVPGRILGINLRGGNASGRPLFYDIKMLTPSGQVVRVQVDARTASVRGVRGAGRPGPGQNQGGRRGPGQNVPRFGGPGQNGPRFGGPRGRRGRNVGPRGRGPFAGPGPGGPRRGSRTFRRGPQRNFRRGGRRGQGFFGGRNFRRGGRNLRRGGRGFRRRRR